MESVLGKNFRKIRVSEHKKKKIKKLIFQKLKSKYGKYVYLHNFRIKNPQQCNFKTNLDTIFTVPGYGFLYGCYYHKACGNIFLTQHCLERFEERVDKNSLIGLTEVLRQAHEVDHPTDVDLISALIISCNFEYSRYESYLHLNIGVGILVLEDLGEVYIAKTFLSPSMCPPPGKYKWYRHEHLEVAYNFADIMKQVPVEIDHPEFFSDSNPGKVGR
jgi:hypothetical protein